MRLGYFWSINPGPGALLLNHGDLRSTKELDKIFFFFFFFFFSFF